MIYLIVCFLAYGGCQKIVANARGIQSTKELSILDNGISGFMAAFFSSFSLCPTELIKCKLQAMRETTAPGQNVAHITPYQLTKQILRSEGIPGLYRGLTSTMMREMPGYFFFFGAYEGSRELLRKYVDILITSNFELFMILLFSVIDQTNQKMTLDF